MRRNMQLVRERYRQLVEDPWFRGRRAIVTVDGRRWITATAAAWMLGYAPPIRWHYGPGYCSVFNGECPPVWIVKPPEVGELELGKKGRRVLFDLEWIMDRLEEIEGMQVPDIPGVRLLRRAARQFGAPDVVTIDAPDMLELLRTAGLIGPDTLVSQKCSVRDVYDKVVWGSLPLWLAGLVKRVVYLKLDPPEPGKEHLAGSVEELGRRLHTVCAYEVLAESIARIDVEAGKEG